MCECLIATLPRRYDIAEAIIDIQRAQLGDTDCVRVGEVLAPAPRVSNWAGFRPGLMR